MVGKSVLTVGDGTNEQEFESASDPTDHERV